MQALRPAAEKLILANGARPDQVDAISASFMQWMQPRPYAYIKHSFAIYILCLLDKHAQQVLGAAPASSSPMADGAALADSGADTDPLPPVATLSVTEALPVAKSRWAFYRATVWRIVTPPATLLMNPLIFKRA
jgi:hypothetical protein